MTDLNVSCLIAAKKNENEVFDSKELHRNAAFEEKKAVYAERLAKIFSSDAPMSVKIAWAMQCAQNTVADIEKPE